jgi:hypothetical protein
MEPVNKPIWTKSMLNSNVKLSSIYSDHRTLKGEVNMYCKLYCGLEQSLSAVIQDPHGGLCSPALFHCTVLYLRLALNSRFTARANTSALAAAQCVTYVTVNTAALQASVYCCSHATFLERCWAFASGTHVTSFSKSLKGRRSGIFAERKVRKLAL